MHKTADCPQCGKRPIQEGYDSCFACRVKTVAIGTKGPAVKGRWNQTRKDYMLENFGTSDDRELGKRGIERAS